MNLAEIQTNIDIGIQASPRFNHNVTWWERSQLPWWGKMHFNVVVQNFTFNSNKALYNSTTERVEFQMVPDYKTKHLRWKYFCCRNFRKFVKPNA